VIVRDRGVTQCGIVTFTVEGHEPEAIQRQLAASNINVSVAVRSSAVLDMDTRKLTSMIRASVHYYNTEEEVELFIQTLMTMLKLHGN
jgi:selenocysteine lyase/cysteine desulfurase